MEDGAYWQREVDPRATLWILPSASLRRCNETREPGYTRLKRSRISGTMGHQLESLELSPWTRSIRAFQLQFMASSSWRHRNRKVFEAPILGNLFLDSRVEHSYVD